MKYTCGTDSAAAALFRPAESVQNFELTDDRFLSQLGASRWMSSVSRCLKAAASCVETITDAGAACVLKGARSSV